MLENRKQEVNTEEKLALVLHRNWLDSPRETPAPVNWYQVTLRAVNRRFFLTTPQRDRHVSDGTRIRDPLRDRQTFYIVLVSLCQNCARIQRFHVIRVSS